MRQFRSTRYHAPSDDLDQTIDRSAVTAFNRLYFALASSIANRPARPAWRDTSFFKRFATE